MHVHAIIASAINVLANTSITGYDAAVSAVPGVESPADVVAAWRNMTACHAAICAALERELGDRHALGVSDFEVLDRLAESPDRKCRSQDLAESVHLSQSALSRLVDRLVKNSLVERCACDDDRRGIYVVLTSGGLRCHREAAVTHREVLARHLPVL
jgi:DNA-binding MarR family transcriptional regulator